MNVYRMIGNTVGTAEALDLAERLSAWHDAMVAHERGSARNGQGCDDECPHANAGALWEEAVHTLGEKADELRFLRTHGVSQGRAARSAARASRAGLEARA
jgi:hypothetical protein